MGGLQIEIRYLPILIAVSYDNLFYYVVRNSLNCPNKLQQNYLQNQIREIRNQPNLHLVKTMRQVKKFIIISFNLTTKLKVTVFKIMFL